MTLDEIVIIENSKKVISKQVVIYGAGNFAQLCATILQENGYKVVYFIDKYKYKQPQEKGDIPILRLEDERLTHELKETLTCVIGIFNYTVDLALIEQDISSHGFNNIINPLELHAIFYESFGDYFWLGDNRKYVKNLDLLQRAYDYLADEHSKNLFKNILEYRMTQKLGCIAQPQSVKTQYFPEDILINYPLLNFIDCGAYDGDTILNIVDKNIPLHSFVAFEPDIENINTLSKNTQNIPRVNGFIYPCGVYDTSRQLRFSGGTGSSSHISDSGEQVIQVVSIDEVLLNYDVNFIKMDIEGAEIQALRGAEKTIKRNEPILAISAYHKYDDLWTITELIQSWNLDYKCFLRLYEFNGFELVYYMIPSRYLKREV